MKVGCVSCGIHFPQDFKKTLTPQCNYWGDNGMANVPVKLKKKFWDWLFKMPCDELFILTSLGIYFTLKAVPVPKERKFEDLIPGYIQMSEEEKQQAQRAWYEAKKDGGGEGSVPEMPDLSHLITRNKSGKSKAIN